MDQQLLIDGSEIPASTVNVPKISLNRWHLAILNLLDANIVNEPISYSDEEMIAQLSKSGNTIRPRRLELARHLYIEKADMAKTPSGRRAQRWRITDRGRKALDQARLP